MKVFFVNCVYKRGSTGKIVYDTVNYLRDNGHEAVVAYGSGNKEPTKEDGQVHKIVYRWEQAIHELMVRLGLVLMYGGLPLSTYRVKSLIKKEQPDIVHLHCINGNTVNIYALLRFLAKKQIPTVVSHHAEFFYTGSCGHAFSCDKWFTSECEKCEHVCYATRSRTCNVAHRAWNKMKDSFSRFNEGMLFFTAVSPWVKKRSELSPIVKGRQCVVVKNGVETSIFHPCPNREELRKIIPNLNEKIVFHSTAAFCPESRNHLKGGWYVVELAKRMPEVTFIVAAINMIYKGSLPANLYVWGRTKTQEELAMLYSSADVTLITSKKETFSMICAESLCCSTPVVGFEAGGPETITLSQYGTFVPYGEIGSIEKAIRACLTSVIDRDDLASMACDEYNKNRMASNYLDIYYELLNNTL